LLGADGAGLAILVGDAVMAICIGRLVTRVPVSWESFKTALHDLLSARKWIALLARRVAR
jgi:hypothetical protein